MAIHLTLENMTVNNVDCMFIYLYVVYLLLMSVTQVQPACLHQLM
jgi:hypothetical protein